MSHAMRPRVNSHSTGQTTQAKSIGILCRIFWPKMFFIKKIFTKKVFLTPNEMARAIVLISCEETVKYPQ
jgi:hypothetical protein